MIYLLIALTLLLFTNTVLVALLCRIVYRGIKSLRQRGGVAG
jgi:hypothetical protein